MTEFVDPGTRSASPVPGGNASPGALLRHARESAGLHIAALAVSLKVPVKKLEALEADRFDLLTDAVFVRALAGSVCRSLKIDPQAVLPLLPPSGLPRLDSGDHHRINESFRTPSFGSRTPWWTQVSRPAVLAGLVFVVGAALLFLLPRAQDSNEGAVTTEVALAPSVVAPAPVPAAAPAAVPTPAGTATPEASSPASVSEASSAPAQPTTIASVSAQPQALPAAVQPLAAAARPAVPAATVVPAAPPLAANLVTFTTTKTSWIEVVDARGTSVLRRQLAPGEVVGVGGVLPLKALVGRADGTQVQVRGQALDLAPLSKDNVARFEVK